MRRVVVTGMGIVSSIGNNVQEVTAALDGMHSGISHDQTHVDRGFRSHVSGQMRLDPVDTVPRKSYRFMGPGVGYTYIATEEALAMSGLTDAQISNPKTGLVAGTGGGSPVNIVEGADIARKTGASKRIGPYMVTRTMCSTTSAILATLFKIKGINYSMSSACATSAHCIGHGADMIRWGRQDIVLAGGSEELHWTTSVMFDAMGALSSSYNDRPQEASRAFDKDRDGFIISGGGGMVVLEEREHALKRGAPIIAELTGYGATSDGYDMVAPSGEGATRCMQEALATTSRAPDYINAHGTSTPVGDLAEMKAVRNVFGADVPDISSTKSLTGHALGAAGVCEAIYSLIALQQQQCVGSANLVTPAEEIADLPVLRENKRKAVRSVMSNSFGFGGTNATLIFEQG
ncbi:MAG: beta-ketoacyl-ACP synthase I [Alphaproteobacteria bacterium]|nr:beta-ketoacyl-ACP synthase I [Alphaproteobacteria bacterium]